MRKTNSGPNPTWSTSRCEACARAWSLQKNNITVTSKYTVNDNPFSECGLQPIIHVVVCAKFTNFVVKRNAQEVREFAESGTGVTETGWTGGCGLVRSVPIVVGLTSIMLMGRRGRRVVLLVSLRELHIVK